MGRTWDNTLQADSSRMSFGDTRLRYLLIHGCDSLQMHFGQNPFRTWAKPNKGARMIFGFDGLTYDVDGTGAGFFREWNAGKSFSQACSTPLGPSRIPARLDLHATRRRKRKTVYGTSECSTEVLPWDNWYWWRWAAGPDRSAAGIPTPDAALESSAGMRGATPERRRSSPTDSASDHFWRRPPLSRRVRQGHSTDGRGSYCWPTGPTLLAEPDLQRKHRADSIKASIGPSAR
jgi:hypothetical protein